VTNDGDDFHTRDNRCVDCGKKPPPTDTNYTLISTRHGWRLTRGTDKEGRRVMEWRCPTCWLAHRKTIRP